MMSCDVVLIDGMSLLYRAFHALPLMDNGEGEYTNALFGFFSMFLTVLRDETPKYCVVAFDTPAATFRHERYADYKAGRAPMPPEMTTQTVRIRELLTAMGVVWMACPGFEADDLLGTLSLHAETQGLHTLLVTGDRDAFQLAGPYTSVLYTKRGISDTLRVTPDEIQARYGVTPTQLIDVKGLMGDSSDHIPGIPGIGEKTALKLIQTYGSLDAALDRAADEQKGKLRERLMTYADQARESHWLATIDRHVPVERPLTDCTIGDLRGGIPIMRTLKLNRLIERMAHWYDDSPVVAAATPSAVSWRPLETVDTPEALRARIAEWTRDPVTDVAFYVGGDAVTVATREGRRLTCPLGGDLLTPGLDPLEAIDITLSALPPSAFLIGHGLANVPAKRLTPFRGRAFDTAVAAYVLNAQQSAYALPDVCAAAGIEGCDECPAQTLFALCDVQRQKMAEDGLTALFETIEMPLVFVLRDMESVGFCVDADALRQLGAEYRAQIEAISEEIFSLAGTRINLNSPKQLSKLLFDDLQIQGVGKKKGARSTAADTLEALAAEHPICARILAYRRYSKLNSTYVEGLLRLIGPDGRIHTTFEQTATGTGRISSREPNLQNIPVRTELGREIRRAFVAAPGCVLIDADYSQIELRILSHMSGDPVMIDAFQQGQDIHTRTAAEMMNVPLNEVTRAMRSAAKAVNFGIVYGISDFGLSRNLGIPLAEARTFIERYFQRYPATKAFMERLVADGKTKGYVDTLFGRRRYLPELTSDQYNTRMFGERAAMNSPIQGTAADIIKLAMVRVHDALAAAGLQARLILQVHDELIVECPVSEAESVAALVREGMEQVLSLRVPLDTDLSMGGNWNDCKS